MEMTGTAMSVKQLRAKGRVTGIHPVVKDPDSGKPVAGGFIWIMGDNGVAYFGHVTQILKKKIEDLEIGDPCTFDGVDMDKGPAALLIEF